MKLRTMLLAAMLGCTMIASQLSAVRAEEEPWCGTTYPGWWWKVHGPRHLTDMLDIERFAVGAPVATPDGSAMIYPFAVVVHNHGRAATPANSPYSVTTELAGGASVAAGQGFDPNYPASPYSCLKFAMVNKGLLPAVQAGQHLTLHGKVTLPKTLGQSTQGILIGMNFGYDDDDGICPPWPYPWPWPWPWPWWLNVDGDPGIIRYVGIQMVDFSGPYSVQWRGYGGYLAVFEITNKSDFTLPGGAPIAMGHMVSNKFPNPDDPFDPRNPGNPHAEIFREQVASAGLVMPALQPGQSFKFQVRVIAPRTTGYGNLFSLQIGK